MDTWKFSTLQYERPDEKKIRECLSFYTGKVKNAADGQSVVSAILSLDQESRHTQDMANIVHIRHTLDTSDEYYEKENAFLNDLIPTLMPDELAFSDAVQESPFRHYVEEKLGKQYFVQMDLQKKSFTEKNIPLMQQEARLTTEYQKIMASCQIDFLGEKRNLYGIQKFFEHDDRSIRKAAFQAYSDFYHQNEPRLEEIWDELISIRNEMGRNLGFENFIPVGYMQQGRTDYGMNEVASFREQVRKDLVPLCEKLYEAQAGRLGIDHVMVYDEKRIYPDGNASPAGDDDFMIRMAREMYHELMPQTGEFIDFMIEHELMDLKNKPSKASTGYCTCLPGHNAPFVFSCFNQTIFDMQVLTHELGHAFAAYRSARTQPIADYIFPSTDIAEIHSMSMEQFAYPYVEKFFGKDADKYRFAHLQEALTFVPFGVAVDEFQHICYAHPELSAKERTYEWHKLEEKYMPWRRYDQDEFMERGGYWYHKLHIFLYPFYYINYTLTTMGAMEFKKKYAENREKALKDYLALCDIGASRSYLEALRLAGLSVPFEEGSVARSISCAREILEKDLGRSGF